MRIRIPHVKYISHKIAIDLLNSGYVTLISGIEPISEIVSEIITEDLLKEKALDEKVNEILDDKNDDIYVMQIDKRNMFWLVKKKLATEANFELSYEDRYTNISHQILETLWKKNLIEYSVSENKVKNSIYQSIENYLKNFEKIEDEVYEKIEGYKRKLIPGTEEYDFVFEKLYEEELKKRGMF